MPSPKNARPPRKATLRTLDRTELARVSGGEDVPVRTIGSKNGHTISFPDPKPA